MTGFIGKYFWKIKICLILFLLIFIVPFSFIIYFVILGMSGYDLLHVLSRFQFYICFLWICLTFYYLSSADRNYVREASGISGKSNFTYENIALFWIFVKIIIWNLGMVLVLCIGAFLNDGTGYFFSWFWKSYLYNVFLPQIICTGLVYWVIISKNQIRWFGFLVLFIFMISPFTESIIWTAQPSWPVDQIWNGIRWPFTILYQNGEWSPDLQYGLQTETVRLYLFFFWIFFIFCLVLSRYHRKKAISFLSGCLSIFMLLASFQPASVYRLNSRWDGIGQDSSVYARNINSVYTKETGYNVSAYKLDISLKNELCVICQMDIQSDTAQAGYEFTLYRGYHVDNVQSLTDGISVSYGQKDDSLIITADHAVKYFSVQVVYKGHHAKFYSNSEAAMLPGWFPWYPVSGKREIYITGPEFKGYNVYNRIKKAKCQINTNQNIISNLEKTDEGVYKGYTDGITVLAGNIIKTGMQDTIMDYLPLGLYKDTSATDYLSGLKDSFNSALKLIETQFGIDVSSLYGKKLLLASKDLGRNIDSNIAVFGDYILAVPEYLEADSLFRYLVLENTSAMQMRQNSAIIQDCMYFLMAGDTSLETVQILKDNIQRQAEFNEEYNKTEGFTELLDKFTKQKKTDILVRCLAGYMMKPDTYKNDNQFIQKMMGQL